MAAIAGRASAAISQRAPIAPRPAPPPPAASSWRPPSCWAWRILEIEATTRHDVIAFLTHVENGTSFTFPIADHASDQSAIMSAAMDEVVSFKGDPTEILTKANEEVNALFQ